MILPVYIYSAAFKDEAAAFAFSEEKYDEDGSASPALWTAIGADWLDHDFVEVIFGESRFDYLGTLLIEHDDLCMVRDTCRSTDNTLILIFAQEGNEEFCPRQTEEPLCVGTYRVQI